MKYKHDKYSFLDCITVDGILDTILFITMLFYLLHVLQQKEGNIMLFNANKKNKEHLKNINELIERLEDIKVSDKYDKWTLNDKMTLQGAKIAKERYEIAIRTNRETYLKNIISISKVVCVSAIVGTLAHIITKDNKS